MRGQHAAQIETVKQEQAWIQVYLNVRSPETYHKVCCCDSHVVGYSTLG